MARQDGTSGRNGTSGIPVIVDEWIVVLRAHAALPATAVRRLVAMVDAELAAMAETVNAAAAGHPQLPGVPAQVVVSPRGP